MTLLAQLSGLHISTAAADGGAAANLERVVAATVRLAPDAVIVTGDLASGPQEGEYERVRELLAPLTMPVHVLSGNHDDPDGLREHLGAPGPRGEPLQYVAEVGELKLVVADTTLRGRGDGELGPARLAWIEEALAEEPDRPTLLALHHPPVDLGIPAMDAFRLAEADQRALCDLLRAAPQVRRLLCGHLHRTMVAGCGGAPVFVCPATSVQVALRQDARDLEELEFTDEPPGLAVHRWADGELATQVVAVV